MIWPKCAMATWADVLVELKKPLILGFRISSDLRSFSRFDSPLLLSSLGNVQTKLPCFSSCCFQNPTKTSLSLSLLFLSARNKRSSIFLKLHTQTLKEKTSNKSTIQTLESRNRELFPYPNAAAAAATLTRKPTKQKQSSSILISTDKTTFRDPSQFPLNTQFQKPAEKAQILQLHNTNLFRFLRQNLCAKK